MSVAAVVLSYNNATALGQTLDAIGAQTRRPDHLLVVDNASTDAAVAVARSRGAEVLELPDNLGVGAGHNAGWRAAIERWHPRFVWSLEHDSHVAAGCLERLLAIHDHPPRGAEHLGAVHPVQAVSEPPPGADAEPVADRSVTFNACLLRVDAIEEAGPLREDFFVGQEDREFSQRLRRFGWQILMARDTHVIHANKGSAKRSRRERESPTRLYYARRNELRLLVERREVADLLLRSLVQLRPRRGSHRIYRARCRAVVDALSGRMGPRSYGFMDT